MYARKKLHISKEMHYNIKERLRLMAEKDIPGGGNRRIKDSMFVDLFGKDVSAKENFLSLYNALHGTDLRLEDTKLEPEMIDGAVYMSYANDVAMMVNGQVVVLIEHQSTINQNMPLRLLDYVTRIYERIIPARKKSTGAASRFRCLSSMCSTTERTISPPRK